MIEIKNVTKSYETTKALTDVSISINKGEIIGLIGPNGAGKSTLMKCMTGLSISDSGTITLNGFDVQQDQLSAKEQCVITMEEPEFYNYLTGLEFLQFIADLRKIDRKILNEKVKSLFEKFNMTEKTDTLISDYSHGMRQKLSLISGLMCDVPIYILDEPTNGLDPTSIFNLKALLKEYSRQEKTIIFSSHILATVEQLCYKVVVINKGEIVAQGETDSIIKNKNLEETFMQLVSQKV